MKREIDGKSSKQSITESKDGGMVGHLEEPCDMRLKTANPRCAA
jgi:hypothetical protein